MTPKEKAKELFNKMDMVVGGGNYDSKEYALIAVNEILESTKQLIHHYTKGNDERYSSIYLSMSLSNQYWQEVKQEIEKL